ncbi:BirA family biotin operon repressor/biotin-[acetyl-CoA-carboxylase] ligase [Dyadobacter sp. BE34]|uniref:BirA family biotin operon repressor/biotin-[acetyl-CoA-carboxylase] ligase n=1 Tax=Dyadobacter fermentans TaxID=94254 RepID=A0ABU1QSQ7_9BACT|nr:MULTISPECIES: biotin--[acetyl-CoA-carboxylase] ligase [Dyadobacter]MDR6804047.1 BirA family biotin operon repressor/biotin-[acetyl-CoA-carboxylase] ligase [Dyadobacter fermentans]MDR7041787.1 BirA family biotin operon repressor/biotin-[acetyl-CoA-carboxylase] ligase [Dyadobacter sp. BE242]MDR7196190.1 BirA family biotin operon repressor/biotin-[acetyl-CoA-carboxylase] ligase [Dyadobacter sp. BE34]MDR7213265.1 BirA family biotin operon repressor/biotin-[acetyl-CoA-carboxylase] ligase [Dyadoba
MYNSTQDTLIIGKKVIYLPTCHSTNDIAAEIVHAGLFEEGTVVITDNQVKGRGQRGTVWNANAGENLTFSVILKPAFLRIQDQFLISQITALGIRAYLGSYVPDTKVKWPNDIYMNNHKAVGVLIENSLQGARYAHSIVGIGVNINQPRFENSHATSLRRETGSSFVLAEEFHKLLKCLDAYYVRLRSGNQHDAIRAEYLGHLYGYQQNVKFLYKGNITSGSVTNVTELGKLRVKLATEPEELEFGLKEIEWVRD